MAGAAVLLAGCVDFQDAQNTFCAKRPDVCGASAADGGATDAGNTDAGPKPDSGTDAGPTDAGAVDAGVDGGFDAGFDAGAPMCAVPCSLDGGLPDGGALPPHVVYTCVATNTCGTACAPLWGDCNQDAGDGCETSLKMDANNCGACGHLCANAHATASCAAGACHIACMPDFANCDGMDFNGCEVSLWTDNNNCGVCGFGCGAGRCVSGGVCQLTSGGESVLSSNSSNGLIADANALYWANPGAVRSITKSGGNLHTLYAVGTGPNDLASTYGNLNGYLAVDSTSLYVGIGGEPVFYAGDKVNGSANGPPSLLGTPTGGHGGPTGMFVDADPNTGTASHLTWAEMSNAPGVYRYTFADAGWVEVDNISSDALSSARGGTRLFTAYANGTIRSFDMAAAQPLPQISPVGMLTTETIAGMTSDGVNLWVVGNNAVAGRDIYKFDVNDSMTMNAHCGATGGVSNIVGDGTSLYLCAGDVYKMPINQTGGVCSLWVDRSTLIGSPVIIGIAVDGTSVYFATATDVFKAPK